MARNGSGTYSLASGNPVVTGTTISSTTHNNTMTDIETALTDSLTANGEKVWSGTQDANGNKIILDVDADTSITADTDDQIDVEVAGSDQLRITASVGRLIAGTWQAPFGGFGTDRTEGTLHVHTASAGTVSASSVADDLIVENSASAGITINTPDASTGAIYWTDVTATGNPRASIIHSRNSVGMTFATFVSGNDMLFKPGNNSESFRLTGAGNININTGTTQDPTSADGSIVITNSTAPTGNITNSVILYAEDVSTSSELKVRDEAGNVTVLSPHNFTLFEPDMKDPFPWSYYSKNDLLGKEINVDMAKAIRLLEELTGEQLIYTADIPKREAKEEKEERIRQTIENNRQTLTRTIEATDDEEEHEEEYIESFEDAKKRLGEVTVKAPPKWLADRGVSFT